jgi:hypothetical protein
MVYYVALPLIPIEGGLAPGEAVESQTAPPRSGALKSWRSTT